MVLKNIRLVKIFIFSSYYNVNGISMARRYWKIPSSSFEVEAIPPPPSASPPEVGSIASTSQDSEGIFQYLLAMLMPLLQWHMTKNQNNYNLTFAVYVMFVLKDTFTSKKT